MSKYLNLFLILIISVKVCTGQTNFGPRLTAMGNNGAAVKDVWGAEANPAGITDLKNATIALNYAKYLFDSELSRQAIAFVLPMQNNYLGFNFQRYGISEYNEIKTGLTLAKKFGEKLSIALKGNYHQIKISNYGASTGFSVDVGAIYNFNEILTFGASISNPSLQKYSTKSIANAIPTVINIGAAYQASNKLLIATTISKDLKQILDVAIGIDYKLIEILSLRGGLTAKPFKQYVGFGINYKKLMMDMALGSDPHLGFSPQIALAYAF